MSTVNIFLSRLKISDTVPKIIEVSTVSQHFFVKKLEDFRYQKFKVVVNYSFKDFIFSRA